jgi:hypothetical protein
MTWLRFTAFALMLSMLVGCGGSKEVKPDATGGKMDTDATKKAMEESFNKMPPEYRDKMKASMPTFDLEKAKNEKKAGAGVQGPQAGNAGTAAPPPATPPQP